jgi:hypothetical protein
MTENKLQCYIKSVKHDTKNVVTTIIPFFWCCVKITCAVTVAATILFLLMVGYRSAMDAIIPFTPVIMQYISQYNLYLVGLFGIDICILYAVRGLMKDPDPTTKDPTGQIGLSLIALACLFGVNVLLISCGSASYNPSRFDGWSYMTWETAINAILIVIGIFLMRAYVRCEELETPVKPEPSEGE